ncbi:antibiotic biosynthesis monooxygenase [Pseudokineococcus lusitanus]|uniref:antibiotic biosynthesis monooxygenase n=1 Tax=Pseudokineococcus lusitanus TaxID=763993 RepID=UPI000F482939
MPDTGRVPHADRPDDVVPPATTPEPVTVATTRVADPGQRLEMMTWVSAGARLAESAPGFLGAGWVRGAVDSREWHMLYRFADEDALARWEGSPERLWWLAGAPGTVRPTRTERRTGIEGWFDAADGVVVGAEGLADRPRRPPRWRQALVIYSVFLPLSLLVNLTLGAAIADHVPLWLRVVVTTTLMTPVMTYLALPWATRRLQWFLDAEPPPWRRRRPS